MKTTVKDIMSRSLLYLAEGTRAALAREQILRFGVTAVPVLDEDGRPIGIVSLRDLLAADGPCEPKAPVFSIASSTPIESAARALAESDYHHVVVVDEGTGRAVGMVSTLDLLRAMLGMPPRHPAAFESFGPQTQAAT
jgi:CBS domain-containing protein